MQEKNETTLYRKYRPQTFADVSGQEQVTAVLEKAIKKGEIGHAYIFAGSRGTGKTSVARIFAREVGVSSADTYEIDAASNRGVDEVRAIREAVHTLPFESPYKIYILDEAHMLTREAWNALLKTLEEPPKHVIFILATTELEKVPETVLSRCQTFSFKRPTEAIIREVITSIAESEGYTLERPAGDLVALLGEGSFRDAESLLQKLLSFADSKTITRADVERVTGVPRGAILTDLLKAVAEGDLAKSLKILRSVEKEQSDMKLFVKLFIERIRAVMLVRFAPDLVASVKAEYPEEDFKEIERIAHMNKSAIQSKTLDAFLGAYSEIGFAAVKVLPVELALIKLLGQNSD